MQKNYFHNYKTNVLEVDKVNKISVTHLKKKSNNVDINQLLNRVKDIKKNKRKEKIIILGTALMVISLMGILVIFTK